MADPPVPHLVAALPLPLAAAQPQLESMEPMGCPITPVVVMAGPGAPSTPAPMATLWSTAGPMDRLAAASQQVCPDPGHSWIPWQLLKCVLIRCSEPDSPGSRDKTAWGGQLFHAQLKGCRDVCCKASDRVAAFLTGLGLIMRRIFTG